MSAESGPEQISPGALHPLRTVLVSVLSALAAFDPSVVFTVGPFLAAATFLLGRPLSLRLTAPVYLSLALLAWVALSTLWSTNPTPLLSVLSWAALLIVFIAVRDYIRSRGTLRAVAIGFLVGTLVGVVRVILAARQTYYGDGITRVVVGYVNVNYLGYSFAAGAAAIVLLWVTGKSSIAQRMALIMSAVALSVGIEIAETRGAYVGVAAVAAWVVACKVLKAHSIKSVVALLVGAAVLIVVGIADQASLALETGDRATGDWSGRLQIWHEARTVWNEHPLIGIGAGAFRSQGEFGIAAHNALLSVGADLGIIGVLLFVSLIWTSLREAACPPLTRYALLVGAFLGASAPAYLSGAWETAPAAWVLLALFSRISVLSDHECQAARRAIRSRGVHELTGR